MERSTSDEWEAGDNVGAWIVDRYVRRGSTGSVLECHRARDPSDRAVVKICDVADPSLRSRFAREGNLLLKLVHPGVLPVRSAHFDDDPPYLVLEAHPGEELGDLLARHGALTPRQALSVVARLCETLAWLHENGRYHRDLKPASLLVDGDRVLVTDFGVAREAGKNRLTQPGMFVGTVDYAPPEWAQPNEVDPATWDLYAVGVLLLEMVTGRPAHVTTAAAGTMDRAVQVTLAKRSSEHLDPGELAPERVRALVRALTARDPAARPRSASAVREQALALLGAEGLTPLPPPARTPPAATAAPVPPAQRPTLVLDPPSASSPRPAQTPPPRAARAPREAQPPPPSEAPAPPARPARAAAPPRSRSLALVGSVVAMVFVGLLAATGLLIVALAALSWWVLD